MCVGVKTFYLLGNAGSDLLAVSSFPTWRAAPPLCPARLLSTVYLDKKQLWPTARHLYTVYIHSQWMETVETVSHFILGGSKTTADAGWTHEIKKDAYSLEGKLWPT